MTHRELMSRIGWDELHEWIAFERIDPPDDGWVTSGILLSMIGGITGNKVDIKRIYPHLRDETPKDWRLQVEEAKFFAARHKGGRR